MKAPVWRTPNQAATGTSGACDGSLTIDLLDFFATHPGALGNPLAAGEMFNVQGWFRDPPAPKTVGLSDALQFTLAP